MTFDAAKALQNRLVLFGGDEEAMRRRSFDELLAGAGIAKDDFDLEFFDGDSSTPSDWFASVGTVPFMSDRRAAIVRHLLRCDVEKSKATDFSKLPSTALLILVADEEQGSDDRQRTLKSARQKWEKVVTKAGGGSYIFDPDPKGALDGVKKEVAAMGKKISEPAAEALVEMTGGSLSRALDELKKLEMFLGNQEQIRESDVREVVVASREWNVFKMVDSVFGGRVPEALRQLRALVSSQTKAEEAAFSRILPTVSKQLRLLWQTRLCLDANSNASNPSEDVRRMFPSKNNLTAENPYRIKSTVEIARRMSLPQIERCFAIVADTDARLKGSLSSFTALDTLERMLLEMAATAKPM